MANPSPQAIDAIRREVSDWGRSDAEIAADLNAPAVDNPTPQPRVPVPLSVTAILGLVSPASLAKVYGRPAVVAFRDDLADQDRAAVANWATLAAMAGDVTADERAAILAALAATQPDPTWPARIGWAQANLGRPADPDDVAAARPGA